MIMLAVIAKWEGTYNDHAPWGANTQAGSTGMRISPASWPCGTSANGRGHGWGVSDFAPARALVPNTLVPFS